MHAYFTVNRFGQILHSVWCDGYEPNKTKQGYDTKLMSTRILLVMAIRFCIRLRVKHMILLWFVDCVIVTLWHRHCKLFLSVFKNITVRSVVKLHLAFISPDMFVRGFFFFKPELFLFLERFSQIAVYIATEK